LIIRYVDCVDCNYPVCLVREKAGGVIHINNCRSGEYTLSRPTGEKGDRLVCPGVEVLARSMSPVLVARYIGRRIVYETSVMLLDGG
jgi:hypothetical protein